MLRRVALVRTDVSEELSASFIRVTRIDELRTTLAVTSNRRTASVVPTSQILVTLMKEVLRSSETWVLIRATRRNIPEDIINQGFSLLQVIQSWFLGPSSFLYNWYCDVFLRTLMRSKRQTDQSPKIYVDMENT
jgi:hypothetical protein